MPQIRKIAILGAGAMGAFYASRFHAVESYSTVLVATGRRAEDLQKNGVTVNGAGFSIPVSPPLDETEPADLVIVALKHHQLEGALPDLKHLIGAHTLILSVMNGLDSEEMIGAMYGPEKVLYCVAVGIDAVRSGTGVLVANPGRLIFGAADNALVTPRVRRVQEALDRAELGWETPVDMLRALWWKFMVNVGVNQASAVLRAPYGVFHKSPEARSIMTTLMLEVIALAEVIGINLGKADLEEWQRILSGLAPQAKTSMLQDIEAGRKTEVEIFAGKVAALGQQYQIPTPANALMLQLLHVIEEGIS